MTDEEWERLRALASRLDLSMTVVLELCVEKRLSDAEK
jgi:hypothetical protein